MAAKKAAVVPPLTERVHKFRGDPSDWVRIEEVLGRGAFAAVYRAVDRPTGDVIAVKLVYLEKTHGSLESFQVGVVDACMFFRYFQDSSSLFTRNKLTTEITQKETAALSSCRHPNITTFHGALSYQTKLWIFMEYVGPSVVEVLKVTKTLSEDAAAVICHSSLTALAYLHAHHIAHLDIKPSNILITSAGIVKLCDLGVAANLFKKLPDLPKPPPSEPYPWLPLVTPLVACLPSHAEHIEQTPESLRGCGQAEPVARGDCAAVCRHAVLHGARAAPPPAGHVSRRYMVPRHIMH